MTTTRLSRKHPTVKMKLNKSSNKNKTLLKPSINTVSGAYSWTTELPKNQQAYRVKVVTNFLCAGVPVGKIELSWDLLEENGYCLGGRRTMSDLIPFIHQVEHKQVKEEIKRRNDPWIFNGTTRLVEAMSIIHVHFVFLTHPGPFNDGSLISSCRLNI